MKPAGDRDLLRFILSFARRERRANVDFESGERLHRKGGVIGIANFFERDDVGI